MLRSFPLILLVGLSGCLLLGPTARSFPPATGPAGVRATLTTSQGVFDAEVVEVRDAALLVLRGDNRLVLVPYTAIQRGEFDQMRRLRIEGRQPLERPHLEQLRLVSRYPQGVSPELLRTLLAAYGQRELEEIEP